MEWDNPNEVNEKKLKRYKKRADRAIKDIPYYSMSPAGLGFLSFFSFGLYDIYWTYKNWKQVRDESGEKMSPWWRTWFTIFWIEELFQRITDSAETRGYKPSVPVWLITMGYVVSLIAGYGLSRIPDFNLTYSYLAVLFSLIQALCLVQIQLAINANNEQLPQGKQIVKRSKLIHAVFVITSILIGISAYIGWFVNLDESNIPDVEMAEINRAEKTMNSLTAQYETCSTELNNLYDTIDESDTAAINSYNQKYDACEDVRVRQNKAVDVYNELVEPYL